MPVTSKDMLLFLLSSVLVSSHPRRSRGNSSKKEEELVEIVAAGPMDSEEGQFGVAPSIEPLQYKWTLYYERKSKEKRTAKCLNKMDYLNNLTKVSSFQTIRSFWSCWNEVQEQCSLSENDGAANYHMFKDNIKPVWEDPKNAKGGKWVVVLPHSATEEETVRLWMSLALTLLLGEWGVESEINGAVLSARPWGSMLSVWNRNANDKQLIEEVSKKLKELFGVENVKYQRHQATIRRNHAEKAKISRPKSTSCSDDSSSNSDASSSSEGEERSMRAPRRRRFEVSDAARGMLRELVEKVNEIPTPSKVKEEEPEVKVEEPIVPAENVLQQQEEPKELVDEAKKNKRQRRKNNSRRTSTSSTEDAQEVPFVHVVEEAAPKPLPAKRFPLPEISYLHVGLAVAVGVATSALSWASFYY
jgi:translation initiation factor 4E